MRNYRLVLQISYDHVVRDIMNHHEVVSYGIRIKLTKEEKEKLRPILQKRLRRTSCPKVCCHCAFNGWSKTRKTMGVGCVKKRLTEATTINEMRNLLPIAWGAERSKPLVWR